LVHRVAPVVAAVLLHLESLAIVDLRLHRDVVAPLALGALEGDLHPLVGLGHEKLPSWWIAYGSALLEDLGDAAGAHGAATLTDREPQTLVHRDRLTK